MHTQLISSRASVKASSLIKLLDGIVQKNRPVNLGPEHYFPPPYSGLLKVALEEGDFVPAQAGVLCSTNANMSIQGYMEHSTIQSVPVNKCAAAKAVFENHFKFSRQLYERVPLLCNVGYRGTGKSVLQALNMKWYVDKFPGSLAIEVTFNDDQCFNTIRTNEWNFEAAVALRIVHRVLVSQLGKGLGWDAFTELPEKMLLRDKLSILDAVVAARHFANVPDSAPVLLAVDELGKIKKWGGNPATCIMYILALIADQHRDIHFAITVNDYVDLAKISNRPHDLQPLPPLLSDGLTMQQVQSLPAMLRALADENIRTDLPDSDKANQFYVKITKLIQLAGGHPRRLRNLFEAMERFDKVAPPHPGPISRREARKVWGVDFTSALHEWLITENIEPSMEEVHSFDLTDLEGLDINKLAWNVGHVFRFPTNLYMAMETQTFLEATERGLAEFVSFDVKRPLEGHAFLPFPVLQLIAGKYPEQQVPKDMTRPPLPTKDACSYALARVARAVNAFSVPDVIPESHDVGRPLEVLAESAMLLFLLCNDEFTLRQVCSHTGSAGHGNIFDTLLIAGMQTQFVDINHFPLDFKASNLDLESWDTTDAAEFLKTNKTIAQLVVPKSHDNMAADVLCLLPRQDGAGSVLLVIQCKNRRLASLKPQEMVEDWRKGHKYFMEEEISLSKDSLPVGNPVHALLPRPNIMPVFMLFSTNPVDMSAVTLATNECIVDLVGMRRWQPSTAYAAETALLLRQLCRPGCRDEEDH